MSFKLKMKLLLFLVSSVISFSTSVQNENFHKNIKGAFKISGNIDFRNKNILILDDIVTTGATLREIKNSILEQLDNGENTSNIRITVFCLAAAREIKMNRGEIWVLN